jgi:hypothetical protein
VRAFEGFDVMPRAEAGEVGVEDPHLVVIEIPVADGSEVREGGLLAQGAVESRSATDDPGHRTRRGRRDQGREPGPSREPAGVDAAVVDREARVRVAPERAHRGDVRVERPVAPGLVRAREDVSEPPGRLREERRRLRPARPRVEEVEDRPSLRTGRRGARREEERIALRWIVPADDAFDDRPFREGRSGIGRGRARHAGRRGQQNGEPPGAHRFHLSARRWGARAAASRPRGFPAGGFAPRNSRAPASARRPAREGPIAPPSRR